MGQYSLVVDIVSQKCYKFVMFIPTVDNTRTVTDMRINADKLLKEVEAKGMKYIFQKSKPMAVMMNMKLFKRVVEGFEDMADQARIRKIENEPLGKGVSLEDAAKKYGIKLHGKI